MDSRLYLLLTLLCYAVGALHALLTRCSASRLTTVSLTATLVGFAFHTAALSQRWTEAGHFPALGLHDGASFLSWAIVLVFLLVYVTTRVDAAGLFAYPFTFALVFIANLTPAAERADPTLEQRVPADPPVPGGLRLRRALRRLHDGRALPVPGARDPRRARPAGSTT